MMEKVIRMDIIKKYCKNSNQLIVFGYIHGVEHGNDETINIVSGNQLETANDLRNLILNYYYTIGC